MATAIRRNGRFRFEVAYRDLGDDRGLAIHVFGPTSTTPDAEVLRFDCFEKQPHYHVAWSYRNDPFIPIEAEDPFSWAVAKLTNDLPKLLEQAAALPMNETEQSKTAETLEGVLTEGAGVLRLVQDSGEASVTK